MSDNAWIQYVKLYREKHPKLSYKECLQEASKSYKKMKGKYSTKKGGAFNNIDLKDPQMRFEAGISALNSNLAGIGRQIIF